MESELNFGCKKAVNFRLIFVNHNLSSGIEAENWKKTNWSFWNRTRRRFLSKNEWAQSFNVHKAANFVRYPYWCRTTQQKVPKSHNRPKWRVAAEAFIIWTWFKFPHSEVKSSHPDLIHNLMLKILWFSFIIWLP